jgi:hypothetical protein
MTPGRVSVVSPRCLSGFGESRWDYWLVADEKYSEVVKFRLTRVATLYIAAIVHVGL